MELTQEQLDAMVAEKVAEAKKGLFDETELHKRVTSEVDRRVETGIQKGLDTQKKKWEEEFSKKAQMTADEIADAQLKEKLKEITTREAELNKQSNLLKAKSNLAKAGVPESHYEKIVGMLVSEDETVTSENVENFVSVFNSAKLEIETNVKSQLSNIPKPNLGNGHETVTKQDFDGMKYAEKLAFRDSNPQLYKEFMNIK